MASTTMTGARKTVLLFAPAGSPALESIPRDNALLRDHVDLVRVNEVHELEEALAGKKDGSALNPPDAVLFIPPGNAELLRKVWLENKLKEVRWVHCFYAGVDLLKPFISDCLLNPDGSDTGVPLTNGRGAFSSSLAEYAVTAMLHFNKQVPRCQANKAEHKWDKFVMDVVDRKSVVFVGYGNIAQATAKVVRALGMRVIALKRNPNAVAADAERADEYYGLDKKMDVLGRGDFVISTLPGTQETFNFFSHAEFGVMKRSAVFVSMGRGTVVDEDALVSALQSDVISGAGLDVYQKEPLDPQSPLWSCKNLLMTAHNADYTSDYFSLGWDVWLQNLECFLDGKAEYASPVNKHSGYYRKTHYFLDFPLPALVYFHSEVRSRTTLSQSAPKAKRKSS
ncbi:D-2-hydroxyacid dehydrogenase [Porphyridium purpureum]|uniref:D-2-hydroxyacid dehydrogenase n=1 Tax=Porphyridium purpureum TaxID=35688 RepID=A0A5J4YSZ7_PORPP|nr:D-2-hydroxyacid dehydrogenase [Porphyridium purpureum]|eukprot:POR6492..scf229_5